MRKLLYLAFLSLVMVSCKPSTTLYNPLNVEEFSEIIKEDGVQLLDVRTLEEFNEGHIPGATLIDSSDSLFVEHVKSQLNKEQPIALYCRSGKRSKKASDKLVEHGFVIYDLTTGILGWEEEGLPIDIN